MNSGRPASAPTRETRGGLLKPRRINEDGYGRASDHNGLTVLGQGVLVNEVVMATAASYSVPIHSATVTGPHPHAFFKRCTVRLPEPQTKYENRWANGINM